MIASQQEARFFRLGTWKWSWIVLIGGLGLNNGLAAAWQQPVAAPSKVEEKNEQEKSREGAGKKSNVSARAIERAIERKAELLTFVERHEPEVKALLGLLETRRPDQFRSALAGLSREIDRLTAIQNRDPERFELELRDWKNNKRIQIVTAKISLRGETPEAREELRTLLNRRLSLRQEALQLELARTRDRTAKLEQQLMRAQTQSAADLDKQLDQILVNARRLGKSKGNNAAENKEPRNEK